MIIAKGAMNPMTGSHLDVKLRLLRDDAGREIAIVHVSLNARVFLPCREKKKNKVSEEVWSDGGVEQGGGQGHR